MITNNIALPGIGRAKKRNNNFQFKIYNLMGVMMKVGDENFHLRLGEYFMLIEETQEYWGKRIVV
ncbi:hypothetical protein QWY93_09210 [Echinicola jeungdonensis]|uniref:Uncharacterized protein n=1 Tax=Echinicola jeungdonensis TaxID=709343 RepID=A0ABV5J899_9BACT|nr:hypothetical protein [Echinicola jeungdonensis]MDN3669509.1 hypothetical protein [Echinicola jeungdonensis]